VQQRSIHELDAGRRQRVQLDACVGGLQQPGRVRDLGRDEPARAQREQAVALAEPMLE
jgi:hypothetical protein